MTLKVPPDTNAPDPSVPEVPTSLGIAPKDVAVLQEDPDTPGAWIDRSDRLRVLRVHQGADDQAAQFAEGVYVFDEASEPMVDDQGTFQADYLSRAVDDLDPNRLIKVQLPHPDVDGTRVLFVGYPTKVQPSWGDAPDDPQEGLTFTLTGVAKRLDTDPQCAVIGRYVHGNILEGEDPGGPGGAGGTTGAVAYTEENLRLLRSQPCVFNESSRPNRSPLTVAVTVAMETGSLDLRVPIFAPRHLTEQEGQPVKRWTYAAAYLYLWYLYAIKPYADAGDPPPVAPDTAFLLRLNLIATADPVPDPLAVTDPLTRAMLAAPDNMAVDETMLLTAMQMLMRASDTHLHIVYPSGIPTARMWVTNQGNLIDLTRTAPRTPLPADQSESVTLASNKAMAVTCTYDHTASVNTPIVVGDVRRYEVTVDLIPGWVPQTHLDDVNPNNTDAVQDAKDFWRPLGYERFPDGDTQFAPLLRSNPLNVFVSDILRKWVLNEAGQYDADTYARGNSSPYGADAYQPFDWDMAGVKDFVVGPDGVPVLQSLAPEVWAHVPRPLGDPLTARPQGQTGPFVEVSFESGSVGTWYPVTQFDALDDEAGIAFSVENPFEIMPPQETFHGVVINVNGWWDANMVYAIIAGTFRVRATGTIEGDDRLVSQTVTPDLISSIDRPVARVMDRNQFKLNLRSEAGSVLSQGGLEGEQSMHLVEIGAWRRIVGQTLADRTISVNPRIPWLDTGFAIGDRIEGVAGAGLNAEMRSGYEPVYPQIVGMTYHLSENDQHTEIIVGDYRHAPEATVD